MLLQWISSSIVKTAPHLGHFTSVVFFPVEAQPKKNNPKIIKVKAIRFNILTFRFLLFKYLSGTRTEDPMNGGQSRWFLPTLVIRS